MLACRRPGLCAPREPPPPPRAAAADNHGNVTQTLVIGVDPWRRGTPDARWRIGNVASPTWQLPLSFPWTRLSETGGREVDDNHAIQKSPPSPNCILLILQQLNLLQDR